ncbi:MAG TPA: hydroxysqualene dehydroxylase HpnE [Kiloniellales bacterium]|jgi:squalene-associated FAD-dependent desaturase
MSPKPKVHVVGAGIAGLSCAVRLVREGHDVHVHEAAAQAGGRCRSYHDAKLDRMVDNGNHLLLTANRAAIAYVDEIGARHTLQGPAQAAFPFMDLRSGERWTVQPNGGPVPWWLLSPARRIPHTRPWAYAAGLRLAFAGPEATVADCLDRQDPLWARFWEPLTVAALNTAPEEASARLLWLVVRATFARGEAACRPLIARDGLAASFVDPAMAKVRAGGGAIDFNRRLRAIVFAGDRAQRLDFGETQVPLAEGDRLVLAVPPPVAASLLPDLQAPHDMRPIVNAHIRLPAPPVLPAGLSGDLPLLGLIGGTTQWLIVRGDVVSLTISAAAGQAAENSEALADTLWREAAAALALDLPEAPPVRIVKERRATIAQTPQALRLRPPARTPWHNVVLAGDWTDTGYPATIESAVRSGWSAVRACTDSR